MNPFLAAIARTGGLVRGDQPTLGIPTPPIRYPGAMNRPMPPGLDAGAGPDMSGYAPQPLGPIPSIAPEAPTAPDAMSFKDRLLGAIGQSLGSFGQQGRQQPRIFTRNG